MITPTSAEPASRDEDELPHSMNACDREAQRIAHVIALLNSRDPADDEKRTAVITMLTAAMAREAAQRHYRSGDADGSS